MSESKSVSANVQSGKAICSFCGKSQDEVRTMVSGPNGVFICDESVVDSLHIIGHSQLHLRLALRLFLFVASIGHGVSSIIGRIRTKSKMHELT